MNSEEIPKLPIFYVFVRKAEQFSFVQPTRLMDFHKNIKIDTIETKEHKNFNNISNTLNVLINEYIKDKFEISRVIDAGEINITEKNISIQRRLHNLFDVSFKDVLDVEYVLVERMIRMAELSNDNKEESNDNKEESNDNNTYTLHRYPGEGRIYLDFQSKIYQIMIELGLTYSRIVNSNTDKKLLIFILENTNKERKVLSDIVERYLDIESREYERKEVINNMSNMFLPYNTSNLGFTNNEINTFNRLNNLYSHSSQGGNRYSINLSDLLGNTLHNITGTTANNITGTTANNITCTTANNITGTTANNITGTTANNITGTTSNSTESSITGSHQDINPLNIGPTGPYTDIFSERAVRMRNLRRNLGRGDSLPLPFPSLPGFSSFHVDNNFDYEDGDIEVTYSMIDNAPPRMMSASIYGNEINSNISDNLIGNMYNLLRFVNRIPSNMLSGIDLESFREPVRVTVKEDDMNKFISSFNYDKNDKKWEEDIKIKNQTNCTICLADYEDGDKVGYLKTCGHLFHIECIKKWLLEFNHKCPVCRFSADPDKNKK
jgi:hypothetical protein